MALKDANQFFGRSSDMGLRLMARAIEGVERTLHTLTCRVNRLGESSLELSTPGLFASPFVGSTTTPRPRGADDDDNGDDALPNATAASELAARDAWQDAVCDFVKRLVDDPALVQGILAHATEHAIAKLTNTALVRVVLDEKYRRGPRHQYYMEMALFVMLLGCITLDASLWNEAARSTVAAIILLLSYFSFRAVSGMLLWRRSELHRLPKHLGFVESGNVSLVASSAGDMAWKILIDQRYRKRYLDGNSGRNGTSVFEPHSQRDLRDLALLYFAATSARKIAADSFSLGSLLLTWALVVQLFLKGRGNPPLGVAAGFALWIDFFRRLKGATRE
ncbi:MAG: hypothetical protein VXZ39_07045, partial [Planctomycetota bacterium]|nr:hypothetical protein [Planctomycetota bacterium]